MTAMIFQDYSMVNLELSKAGDNEKWNIFLCVHLDSLSKNVAPYFTFSGREAFYFRIFLASALRIVPCKKKIKIIINTTIIKLHQRASCGPLAPSLASHPPLCRLAEYDGFQQVVASKAVWSELCQGIYSLWHNERARVCHRLALWWCKGTWTEGGRGGVVVVCCERKGSSQARDMKLRPVVSFSDMITVGWKKWEIFRDNQ